MNILQQTVKSSQTKVKNEYLEKWETKTAADSCLAVLKQRAHKTKRFLTHFLDQNSLSAIQDLMCTFHIQTSISMWSKIPCVRKELFSLSVMKKITLFGEFTDQINQIGVVIFGWRVRKLTLMFYLESSGRRTKLCAAIYCFRFYLPLNHSGQCQRKMYCCKVNREILYLKNCGIK